MAEPVTGSCLCGKIRFSIDAPVRELRACHCRNCQKASGAGGSVNAVVAGGAFRITQGTPKRYSARADSGRVLNRYFCGDCGSPIYSQREGDEDRRQHLDPQRASVGAYRRVQPAASRPAGRACESLSGAAARPRPGTFEPWLYLRPSACNDSPPSSAPRALP
jgi:hypothetical protein